MKLFTAPLIATMLCGCALNSATPDFQQQALVEREHAANWTAAETTPTLALNDLIDNEELDALIGETSPAKSRLA